MSESGTDGSADQEELNLLRMRWTGIALCALTMAATASNASAPKKTTGAETGLVGIKLYDNAVRIVKLYGSPDVIQAVTIGGATSMGGPAGGGAAAGGFRPGGFGGGFPGGAAGVPGGPPMRPGGPAVGSPKGGGRAGGAGAAADQYNPFGFSNQMFRQMGPPGLPPGFGGAGAPGGPPSGMPGGPAGFGGAGPGGMPGKGGNFGTPGVGGGAAEEATYTRWVYNRSNSKYGFIVDRQGRVLQIEAIGITNPKVRTRRGIGFGNTFAQIVQTYGTPDGYEISGDSLLMRYLTRDKVAFRLTRLSDKKPHVVTGVVVAAGKR
jgi:hypothetical protein